MSESPIIASFAGSYERSENRRDLIVGLRPTTYSINTTEACLISSESLFPLVVLRKRWFSQGMKSCLLAQAEISSAFMMCFGLPSGAALMRLKTPRIRAACFLYAARIRCVERSLQVPNITLSGVAERTHITCRVSRAGHRAWHPALFSNRRLAALSEEHATVFLPTRSYPPGRSCCRD